MADSSPEDDLYKLFIVGQNGLYHQHTAPLLTPTLKFALLPRRRPLSGSIENRIGSLYLTDCFKLPNSSSMANVVVRLQQTKNSNAALDVPVQCRNSEASNSVSQAKSRTTIQDDGPPSDETIRA